MDRTRAGPWTFLVIAVVAAAVFGRLGIWQLDRLSERRDENRRLEARLQLPAYELVPGSAQDEAEKDLAWRRVRLAGAWDPEHTILVRGRSYRGAPGVHVVTPVLANSGRAVLVLRGWLPAADGVGADLGRIWPEETSNPAVRLEGLALPGEPASPIPARTHTGDGREYLVLGSLNPGQAAEGLPYDVLPVFVLQAGNGEVTPGAPLPVEPPRLTDGPHLLYAIQWFGFAAIAVVGAALYYATRRRAALRKGETP